MIKNVLTYISLFSSAGVGCYGFKMAGFECIATNELIERRLNIQKINKKCKLSSGYVLGDITDEKIKNKIFKEIKVWEKKGNDSVDVLIATPPCQGMSVANHKKNDKEIIRNSLVVESIKMIKQILPKVFIFENVPAFMKTGCTDLNGEIQEIGDVIKNELGENYIISHRVLNFKNYGSNSSRKRTLVIGVNRKYEETISPIELFPDYTEEKTINEVIGDLPKLKWGQICSKDFYHQFRTYPKNMRKWIHNLEPGKSAFDNTKDEEKPHKIIDGQIVINIQKNGDKYTRQSWNKVAPCIHTRNDQIASQNTIHPTQDRVFSIRELMRFMTIPKKFKWIDKTLKELNSLKKKEKEQLLKKEEINIRQCIGEAVPTNIFYQIALKISKIFNTEDITKKQIDDIINKYKLNNCKNLLEYISQSDYDYYTLSKISEISNTKREINSAYYTNKFLIAEIIEKLPKFENEIHVLEPSVGVGNFLPLLCKKYDYLKNIYIDVVDIDKNNIKILKCLIDKMDLNKNVHIKFINKDFLKCKFAEKKYDLCIGNPPFTKLNSKDKNLLEYLKNSQNQESFNLVSFFWEKAMHCAKIVALVSPKSLLNAPEYRVTRNLINENSITNIIDNGEKGFKGVLIETVCLIVDTQSKPKNTAVKSVTLNKEIIQEQKYITDQKFPYWIIYRNENFDRVANKMIFDIFNVFRDRQITNSILKKVKEKNSDIRVIKSRNIDDLGKNIIDIPCYDSYIELDKAERTAVYKYLNDENIYLTPNMTYYPRVMKKEKGYLVNGSAAILIPKDENLKLTDEECEYYSSQEYREFYKIARNYQTRSLNVDTNSVFFFGKLKENN